VFLSLLFLYQATISREFSSVYRRELSIKQLGDSTGDKDVPLVVPFPNSFIPLKETQFELFTQ